MDLVRHATSQRADQLRLRVGHRVQAELGLRKRLLRSRHAVVGHGHWLPTARTRHHALGHGWHHGLWRHSHHRWVHVTAPYGRLSPSERGLKRRNQEFCWPMSAARSADPARGAPMDMSGKPRVRAASLMEGVIGMCVTGNIFFPPS